jgi:hypothetical protein
MDSCLQRYATTLVHGKTCLNKLNAVYEDLLRKLSKIVLEQESYRDMEHVLAVVFCVGKHT